jgi:hypothetical protein
MADLKLENKVHAMSNKILKLKKAIVETILGFIEIYCPEIEKKQMERLNILTSNSLSSKEEYIKFRDENKELYDKCKKIIELLKKNKTTNSLMKYAISLWDSYFIPDESDDFVDIIFCLKKGLEIMVKYYSQQRGF